MTTYIPQVFLNITSSKFDPQAAAMWVQGWCHFGHFSDFFQKFAQIERLRSQEKTAKFLHLTKIVQKSHFDNMWEHRFGTQWLLEIVKAVLMMASIWPP